MTPLHGIACFYDVGFGARAVSRKTPIYFINTSYKYVLYIRMTSPLLETGERAEGETKSLRDGKPSPRD